MKSTFLFAALLSVGTLVGCDKEPSTTTTTSPSTTPATKPAQPDNTGMNKRDASGTTKTPMDQGNSRGDIDVTAEIRKSIMADKNMGINAQNVKIITEKGSVTLRGVVDSMAEKDAIGAYAKATNGAMSVDNQIEVKAKDGMAKPPSTTPATPADPKNPSAMRSDGDITSDVKKAISADKSLSTNAQAVTVTTSKGVVTLKGTVDSSTEKDAVAAHARAITGATSVDNQVEIKKPM